MPFLIGKLPFHCFLDLFLLFLPQKLSWVDYLRNFWNLSIGASVVEGIIQEMLLSKKKISRNNSDGSKNWINFKNRVGLELSLHMTLHVLSKFLFHGKLAFLEFLCFLGTFVIQCLGLY
ncbi:hypothetical protein AMTRI_Chr04g250970 [Amborella trichopoda]